MRKVICLQVAALGYDLLKAAGIETLAGLKYRPMMPVMPAVTCSAQGTLRTATSPHQHGMIANGLYLRETYQTLFWSQSARLVKGPRIWEKYRAAGGRVGMYFFQQVLGESVDEIVSPAPIHCHGGKLIMATYQQPEGLLREKNPVALWRYWGPLASSRAGSDIVRALNARIARGDAPECLFIYLPHLDYDLQRFGPQSPKIMPSLQRLMSDLEQIRQIAKAYDYELMIAGDYAITEVTGTVCYPNLVLREAGYFAVRPIRQMRYPDFYQSQAFALCDHQVAHIYCIHPACKVQVRALLEQLPEVEEVREGQGDADLELIARSGCWFAWPWWREASEAPDYTAHVDIHNKPGFDPCELFFGKTPFQTSTDMRRIRGTHGRVDAPIAFASTVPIEATTFQAFAEALKGYLDTATTEK